MTESLTGSGRLVRPLRGTALATAAVTIGAVLTLATPAYGAPSLALSQSCGPSEVGLTVSGSGLAPNEQGVKVYVDRPNEELLTYRPVRVTAAGSYEVTVGLDIASGGTPLPPSVRFGLIDRNGAMKAFAWYNIGCAEMTSPAQVYRFAGQPLSLPVTLTGFAPDTPVQLTIPGVATPAGQLPGGSESTNTFVFPIQPPCGPTTVTARQAAIDHKPPIPPISLRAGQGRAAALAPIPNPPPRVVTKPLMVLCSTLTATPDTFADSKLPASTTAHGTWFAAGYPIDLLFDGKKIGTASSTRKDYAFTQSVRIPRAGCGGHILAAVQTIDLGKGRGTRLAAAPIVLSAATSITVTCMKADLTVNPSVAEGGKLVQAFGARFLPGRQVKLEWVDADTHSLGDAGTATVDAAGGFTVDLLLLPNSDIGPRRLHAVDQPAAGDPRGAREGYADLLVVPGVMQRGRTHFLERG